MGQISLQIPQVGQSDSTEDPKVASDFTTIQAVIDGGLDSTNLAASLAQSAAVNQSGQTVKGITVNSGTSTRTNVAYGALADAADQVTGITLATNGLIAVWFQAVWSESVQNTAKAALFLNANQLQVATGTGPVAQSASIGNSKGAANVATPLATSPGGLLANADSGPYTNDVTTGQILGSGSNNGPCYIFAAAGTYTVSVQYLASSGTVTVRNRTLRAKAISYA